MTPQEIDAALVTWDPLIQRRARKRGRTSYEDADDRVQETRIAFFKACQTFDPSEGASLYTWASKLIGQQAKRAFRRRNAARRVTDDPVLSLDASSTRGVTLHDLLADTNASADLPARVEAARRLHAAIERLPHRERSIIRRRYLEEETLEQVGAHWGICRERVRQIEVIALERLRGFLRDAE